MDMLMPHSNQLHYPGIAQDWGMLAATTDGCYVIEYCTETVTAYLKFLFPPSHSENTDEKIWEQDCGCS